MAELRERSMQAAQAMSQSGVDLSAAANASQAAAMEPTEADRQPELWPAGADTQPELRLDVPNTRGGPADANRAGLGMGG